MITAFLLLISCSSGTPTSKYLPSVTWDQFYDGTTYHDLYYTVKVANYLPIIIYGDVYLKVYFNDGTTTISKETFNSILGLTTGIIRDRLNAGGKQVSDVKVNDDDFYYR
jgi:hypothetical protein